MCDKKKFERSHLVSKIGIPFRHLWWYGTLPYYDLLPIIINNKIKHNLINFFFPEIVT